ncbi:MAG TPA: aminoacyl--tRNA ligase-related protein [Candidatus Bathyarchaeia archaeon]|nr:aminoacyl--tRNA ligase-related protein [Candidatus Bathyarchaeia archaeon]
MFRKDSLTENETAKVRKLISKETDFWNWYLWILQEARIIDTSYSVKGSFVWLDWGYRLFEKLYSFAKTAYRESGHLQMQFPTLIKEDTFLKETDFIRNFENDVFWVDREGHKSLAIGERLALRPTSELIIYPMFAKWIKSWRDLPLKVFQNVSIFRCETNETRPLIRNRETIGFIEGHSAFQTKKEALAFLKIVWQSYQSLFEKLGIPIIMVDVPIWDRFAGSTKTVDGYVILPGGKSMELFTTAYLGTTFSEIFRLQFMDKNKAIRKVHLLCYGPSIDRILASLIAIYGDDHGLCLLPEITPIEIMIVPIFNQNNKNEILDYAYKIKSQLTKLHFSIEINDDENSSPGTKFYETEKFGYPLRVELGIKELQNQTLTVTRRDTLEKMNFNLHDTNLKDLLRNILSQISLALKKQALSVFNNNILNSTEYKSLSSFLSNRTLSKDKMYLIGWCGNLDCCQKIEEETNFTLLGYKFNESKQCKCLNCNKEGKIAVLAKRY